MGRATKNYKNITLSFDADLLKRLDAYCDKERRTRSSAFELAVEKYLEREGFIKEDDKNGKNNSSI